MILEGNRIIENTARQKKTINKSYRLDKKCFLFIILPCKKSENNFILKNNKGLEMFRKTDNYLLNWKNEKNRKVLLVRSARQVGKTYSIRQSGKKF